MKKNAGKTAALALAMAFGAAALAFPQTNEGERGLYVDAGIGIGGIGYPAQLDKALKTLDDNGFTRITVSLDGSIGWAITRHTYLVGFFTGFGDRLFQSGNYNYIQTNTYFFGPGLRHYVDNAVQIGLDAGLGQMAFYSNNPAVEAGKSEMGYAGKLSLAFDFSSPGAWGGLLLGGQLFVAGIEKETVKGFSVFAKLVFK